MENLPETSDSYADLSIDVEDDGVLVMGTPELIDSYIARLREVTNNEVSDSAISKSDLGTIAGVAAGAANATAQHGRYVKISKDSMKLVQASKMVPAKNVAGNYFREPPSAQVTSSRVRSCGSHWQAAPLGWRRSR